MTTAATWRIWSDPFVSKQLGLEQNCFNRARLTTSFNTQVAHARGEDRGDKEEKRWTLCDG